MITKITGTLVRVLDEEVRLAVEQFEYQVLVTEYVRRQLQSKVGEEITLCTMYFLEGNPVQQGKMTPRLLGFVNNADLEFFELFCTVDKIGLRKAMKALERPFRDIAKAIQREDAKWLTTLSGIGPSSADQIVSKLKRKVASFAMGTTGEETDEGASPVDGNVAEEAYQALMGLGMSPVEARNHLDRVIGKKEYSDAQELLNDIFKQSSD